MLTAGRINDDWNKNGSARLSYVNGTSHQPLLGVTIGDNFDETVKRFPKNEALVVRDQGVRLTYRQLKEKVDLLAKGLIHLGICKGDRIGIWSPNNHEWCVTQFAVSKTGAILVNINPAYRLHELEYVLSRSGCAAIIVAPKFKTSDYISMLYELCDELHRCEPGKLESSRLPNLKTVIRLGNESSPGMLTWDEVMASGERVPDSALIERQKEIQFDDAVNIQFTSGTTGFPKGATLSHHNVLNNGFFVAALQGITEKDRMCIPVPLYHCFGMVMANLGCVTHGATMIYPSQGFDPLVVLQTVQEEKCTVLYGVPSMFIAELDHPKFAEFNLSTLRTGIMAGSPCPTEIMKKVNTLMNMSEVQICYGMTETSPVSTQTRADSSLDKRVSTVGLVHPHVEVKIIDWLTGQIVPIGETGELCTRGYSVMLGYWNDEESTVKAIDPARWMHTGDLATMDEEGYVNIVGRLKDMIIRGGENVYPREIEEYLHQHPKISHVQVVGVPDIKYGEEIMAWVKLKPGETADQSEIRDFCKGRIAHYKIPRYIKFTDDFPMTVTGKEQKFLMRKLAIEELGLEIAAEQRMA